MRTLPKLLFRFFASEIQQCDISVAAQREHGTDSEKGGRGGGGGGEDASHREGCYSKQEGSTFHHNTIRHVGAEHAGSLVLDSY